MPKKNKTPSAGSITKPQPKTITGKCCPKCKREFSTLYSMRRHLDKKFICDKRSVKKREVEKKERRKAHNKAYYARRKWGISLSRMSTPLVLDRLLLKISGNDGTVMDSLLGRLRALKQDKLSSASSGSLLAELNSRLNGLKR
ncbi:hypothetical protein PHMEG_00033266 [Phytophthora megakarya]|uniref:Uncharacterized protein n=1 Tax=Phytophthora megakarya TaxID=4795 RepID=A0A225UU34_9STRA|nr:hypothetical protein PHMEG_00033266 [Phytophthora megakarya]